MMRHSLPPSWVSGRSECKLDLTFEALTQVVRRDVEEMNGLLASDRSDRTFRIDSNDEGVTPFFRVYAEPDGPSVTFDLKRSAIVIGTYEGNLFVQPRWEPSASKCRLYVKNDGNHPYEVWQISQLALIDLFFG